MARGMLANAPTNQYTAGPFPVRRDTITVPPKEFAIIRFRADNPGVWIFHCHMQYHMEQGLAMVFVESPHGINFNLKNVPKDLLSNCDAMGIPTTGNALGKVGLDMSGDVHGPYPLTGF
ncbi:ferroxidase fet3 [Coemansia sp. RSA 2559]|nr:ferroxidase fet3 [Coemansia sp. RSA 2559]KAJ2861555.1 ferroxidase fet3 [Coemansia erecta]